MLALPRYGQKSASRERDARSIRRQTERRHEVCFVSVKARVCANVCVTMFELAMAEVSLLQYVLASTPLASASAKCANVWTCETTPDVGFIGIIV